MRKKKKETKCVLPMAELMERIYRDKIAKKISLSCVVGHSEQQFIKDRSFEPIDNPAEMIAVVLFQIWDDFNVIYKEKLLLLCMENNIDYDSIEYNLDILMNLYAVLAIRQHELNLGSLN